MLRGLLLLSLVVAAILSACAGPAPQATPSPSGGDEAQTALVRYFSLLNEGDYSSAARLYRGDYQVLTDWNPDVDPNNQAALLERGCTMNGLRCLPVKEVVSRDKTSGDIYRFTVRFENPDGSLFVRGPCCGATEEEMPSQSDFEFTVVRRGDSFVVEELPVYVP